MDGCSAYPQLCAALIQALIVVVVLKAEVLILHTGIIPLLTNLLASLAFPILRIVIVIGKVVQVQAVICFLVLRAHSVVSHASLLPGPANGLVPETDVLPRLALLFSQN